MFPKAECETATFCFVCKLMRKDFLPLGPNSGPGNTWSRAAAMQDDRDVATFGVYSIMHM